MKRKNKSKFIITYILAAACIATTLTSCMSLADNGTSITQMATFTSINGGSSSDCVGKYYGCFKMTNSAGSIWLSPPPNTSTGTFTNLTSLNPGVNWSMLATRRADLFPMACTNNVNSITFAATNITQYSLYFYINTQDSGITNGQQLTLQINWQ